MYSIVGDVSYHPYHLDTGRGCSHDADCCYLRVAGSEPNSSLQHDRVTSGDLLASLDDDPDATGLPAYVEREFYEYLQCDILAHGFLRLGCESCKVHATNTLVDQPIAARASDRHGPTLGDLTESLHGQGQLAHVSDVGLVINKTSGAGFCEFFSCRMR